MLRFSFLTSGVQTLSHDLHGCLTEQVDHDKTLAEAERLIWQGSVYLNKVRLHDPQLILAAQTTIEVFYPHLAIEEFHLDPARVEYEDEHLLVVNKPPGVNTAPSPFSDKDCLTWGVQKYLGGSIPIHAIHRLDRDTQGLVFFAKHKAAERALHTMFRQRLVRKIYLAATFRHPTLTPPPVQRWRKALEWQGKTQDGLTSVFYWQSDEHWDYWLVLPHTGRPHQIRKHFQHFWLPLVGDGVYGPSPSTPPPTLALACVGYRCRHPITQERLHIRIRQRPSFLTLHSSSPPLDF